MMDALNKHVTRVLFCGFDFSCSHKYTREYLQNHPYIEVDDVAFDEIPNVIGKYDMCVVKNSRLDRNLIARAVKMKLIMQFGVGLEGVDVNAATKQNIKVGRIPGRTSGNAGSCAEMAIYLMLGLLRKQKEMEASVKKKILGDPIGETLYGKTYALKTSQNAKLPVKHNYQNNTAIDELGILRVDEVGFMKVATPIWMDPIVKYQS